MDSAIVNMTLFLGLLPSENVLLMTLSGVDTVCIGDGGNYVVLSLMTSSWTWRKETLQGYRGDRSSGCWPDPFQAAWGKGHSTDCRVRQTSAQSPDHRIPTEL